MNDGGDDQSGAAGKKAFTPPGLTRQLTSHLDQFVQDLQDFQENEKANSDQGAVGSNVGGTGGSDFEFIVGEATDIGGGAVNQDACSIFKAGKNDELLVLSVYDGHGSELGQLAAQVARDKIQSLFEDHEIVTRLEQDAEKELTHVFKLAHEEIKLRFRAAYEKDNYQVEETEEGYLLKRRAGTWSCTHGGTTATVVVIFMKTNRMVVANVGDSTALWGGIDENGQVVYEELSAEHSPESVKEFKRVRSFRPDSSGVMPEMRFVYDAPCFSKFQCPPVFNLDPQNPDAITITGQGNYYKNVRNEWATLVTTPPHARFQDALAFTRSLGDLHLHIYGVSSTPEIIEFDLKELHNSGSNVGHGISALLVCTDGVWDNWKFGDIVQETLRSDLIGDAFESGDGMNATEQLMKVNLQLARNHFGNQADNMTAILCYVGKKRQE